MSISTNSACATAYEVCFRSLFRDGLEMCFQCDEKGRVCLDELSERALQNYLFARALIGRDFAWPEVRPATPIRAPGRSSRFC